MKTEPLETDTLRYHPEYIGFQRFHETAQNNAKIQIIRRRSGLVTKLNQQILSIYCETISIISDNTKITSLLRYNMRSYATRRKTNTGKILMSKL